MEIRLTFSFWSTARIWLVGFLFISNCCEFAFAKISESVEVAVLDTGPGSPHESQVVQSLTELLNSSIFLTSTPKGRMFVKTFPIYTPEGALTETKVLESLKQAENSADIIHLSWNILSSSKTIKIEAALKALAHQKIVIASAGNPEDQSFNQKLETTVLGKTTEAFIVGELDSRNHLSIHSFYGPEMFTAFTPVHGRKGSSFSSIKLTAAIARHLSQTKSPLKIPELKKMLLTAKQKSFSSTPTLHDLGLD